MRANYSDIACKFFLQTIKISELFMVPPSEEPFPEIPTASSIKPLQPNISSLQGGIQLPCEKECSKILGDNSPNLK